MFEVYNYVCLDIILFNLKLIIIIYNISEIAIVINILKYPGNRKVFVLQFETSNKINQLSWCFTLVNESPDSPEAFYLQRIWP